MSRKRGWVGGRSGKKRGWWKEEVCWADRPRSGQCGDDLLESVVGSS